jgi:very-short-patch-repair endonuclease
MTPSTPRHCLGIAVIRRRDALEMSDSRIAAIARAQLGLITREQVVRDLGISSHTLRDWVEVRRLEPVRRGVYRVAGAPPDWRQSLLGAVLAAGPSAHVSFRSAACLFGFEGFDEGRIEITRFGRRPSAIDGVVVHESAVFGPDHVHRLGPVPVTSVARTLCDLTAVVRPWAVERAVDEGLRRGLVSLAALRRVAEALEGRGRLRCTVMREILERRVPGYDAGESAPERRIATLLVRAGIPEPRLQHRVRVGSRTYRIDLCYPDERIGIEYDGWDFHRGRQAFDTDRVRANDLVVLGFQLLRFTSRSSDQTIVDTVRAARARASAS